MPNNEATLAETCLTEVRRIAALLDKIAESLLILGAKRATLEERSISAYLRKMAARYGRIIGQLSAHATDSYTLLSHDALMELSNVTGRATQALDDLIRAARYDANYLEQYFEYDFNARLTNEYRFLDELERISSLLGSSATYADQL
ncbi:MAG TPA: hypothetical protein V6D08_07535 [Candidatus Obscuribacterales bacterium]